MAAMHLHVWLLVLIIWNFQTEELNRSFAVNVPTNVVLLRNYLDAGLFHAVGSPHTPTSVRSLSNSLRSLAVRLSSALFCPHTHHDSARHPRLGRIKSLCGRLTLVINPTKNSEELLGVYTISVPVLFYLNVSFLGFHMDPGEVDYPSCDWSDIVFKASDQLHATLCGRPYQRIMFIEESTLNIMTYHDYSLKSKTSSLVVSLEYQVTMRYPQDEGTSLQILLHSAILGRWLRMRYTYLFFLEECPPAKSLEYYTLLTNRQEVDALPFVDFSVLQTAIHHILGLHPVEGINNVGLTEGVGYIQVSQAKKPCKRLKHNVKDFFQTNPISRAFVEYFGRHDKFRPDSLRKLPHSGWQFQHMFAVAHALLPDDQTASVRVWSFNIFPFIFTGALRLNTLSVYMPNQDCWDRQSDKITVYDGPYAGILTPSGLMSHVPIIATTTCSDVVQGEFYNGSVGDLTLIWRNQFGLNASITFLYFVFPSACAGQSCAMSEFSVKLDDSKSFTFSNPNRPKFTILKFSGFQSNVKLRVLMKEYSARNYAPECRLSGVFIVDNVLRMTLCSYRAVARFDNAKHWNPVWPRSDNFCQVLPPERHCFYSGI